MGRVAAFFDIDGTLYREGFIGDLFKMMVKCDLISFEDWYENVRPEFINWDRRLGTYDTYLLKMSEEFLKAIKGRHESLINHIVTSVIKEKALRTYVYTRRRIHWHRKKDHLLITISGSPHDLVGKIAEFYNFHDYIGTSYHLDDNKLYTGEFTQMWDKKSKKKAVESFVEKYDIDLSKSYSYGDSAGDYTMLSMVGNPTMINPTRELLQMVYNDMKLLEKVKLIVERKDVTYDIPLDNLNILNEQDISNEDL